MIWTEENTKEVARMTNDLHLSSVEIAQKFGMDARNMRNQIAIRKIIPNPSRWAVEVSLVEKHEISLTSKCLDRLGVGHRIYSYAPQRPGQRQLYRAVIRAHKDVLRFSEIIGFNTSHRRDRLQQMVHSISEGGVPSSVC